MRRHIQPSSEAANLQRLAETVAQVATRHRMRRHLGCTVNDIVLLPKYGGTEVKINDEEYQIVREDDIVAVIG